MTPPPRIRRDPRERPVRPRREDPAPAARETRIVPDDAPLVLVVADLDGGRPTRRDREALAAARRLADAIGGALAMLAHAAPTEERRRELQDLGLDRLVCCPLPEDREGDAEARASCLVAAVARLDPRHVIAPDGGIGGEATRRAAARLGERPAAGVVGIGAGNVDGRVDSGRAEVTRPTPRILLIAPDAFAGIAAAQAGEAKAIALDAVPVDPPRVRVLETLAADPRTLPLTEADLVLSGGNGVTDWASFHRLAALLGAAEAGSRVTCDQGALPRDRQVGASGVLVQPRCYLALGIAGASQHLEGIAGCERVVAVNIDPHAEMLKRANLAVVTDAQRLMPALIALLEGGDGA